jgi:hypothetical protein
MYTGSGRIFCSSFLSVFIRQYSFYDGVRCFLIIQIGYFDYHGGIALDECEKVEAVLKNRIILFLLKETEVSP